MPDRPGKPHATPSRRWQYSLRTFVIAVLIGGPLLGIFGPAAVEWLKRWTPRTEQPRATYVSPPPESVESGYYESAETPLD